MGALAIAKEQEREDIIEEEAEDFVLEQNMTHAMKAEWYETLADGYTKENLTAAKAGYYASKAEEQGRNAARQHQKKALSIAKEQEREESVQDEAEDFVLEHKHKMTNAMKADWYEILADGYTKENLNAAKASYYAALSSDSAYTPTGSSSSLDSTYK